MPGDEFSLLPAVSMDGWRNSLPPDFLPHSSGEPEIVPGAGGWLVCRFAGAGPDVRLPQAPEDVRTPEDLPPGVVFLRGLHGRLAFSVPVPFGLDLHWLKEVAEGVLRGATGVRLQTAGSARLHGEWTGDWVAALRREDVGGAAGIRVAVSRLRRRGAGAEAAMRWSAQATPEGAARVREIVAALLGIHPLNWARGLLNDLGGKRVEEFVSAAGATLRGFDAVRELWQSLSGREEAALWDILANPARWAAVRQALASLAGGEAAAETAAALAQSLCGPGDCPWKELADWAAAVLESAGAGGENPGLAAAALQDAARKILRALETEGAENVLLAMPVAATRQPAGAAADAWARERLAELFGSGVRLAEKALGGGWDGLAARIAGGAAAAVRRQWELRLAAAVGRDAASAAAADVTWRLDPAGLRNALRTAAGDLDAVFAGHDGLLRMRRAVLAETFRRRFVVEVSVPFLRLRRKQKDLASLASAEAVVTPDGRIQIQYAAEASDVLAADFRNQSAMVLSAALAVRDGEVVRDHFTLAFSERRELPAGSPRAAWRRVLALYGLGAAEIPDSACRMELTLRLPGALADIWMHTPLPGSAGYIPAMSRAASAVQTMAREWLPALYLSGLDAFTRPSAVQPLLAWACSPPSSGPRKKDLSYDFMDPKVVDAVLQACAGEFRQRLADIWQVLAAAGRRQTASYYEPADARYILANVRRQQRNFVSLLAADAFLVEAVLHVAECARELDRLARTSPKSAVPELARFTREVAETFHRKLRRLYAGEEFLALGPLFFLSATSALAGEQGDVSRIAALLVVESDAGKAAFANDAARRLL